VHTWAGRHHGCSGGKKEETNRGGVFVGHGWMRSPAVSLQKTAVTPVTVREELVWLKPTGGTTLKKLVRRWRLLSPLLN